MRGALLALAAGVASWSGSAFAQTPPDPCDPVLSNKVVCENSKTGNPKSEWDIVGSGDATIQGFATDISVAPGGVIRFKVQATTSYRIDIYRLGYYAGQGARKIATLTPPQVQVQPDCLFDSDTLLTDCGNWAVSATWNVPSTAVSGVYIARLVRLDNGGASHVVFVVRDDDGHSDILYQTADTTWQAYNQAGASLYVGRAFKVSYNRPFVTRDIPGGAGETNWVFWAEYPMIRWLEANGYDVSYSTGVDTDRRGAELLEHKVFLSVGHDEYWSAQQRAYVEAARDAGVSLMFLSGNAVYWKIRWEPSIDGSGTAYRTMVCYKETKAGAKIDPDPAWTGTWRDARLSPPSDGGRPENRLKGTIFMVNRGPGGDWGTAIKVPEPYGKMRPWRNTSVASLGAGQEAILGPFTLGYEWDTDIDNGFRPPGLFRLSATTETVPEMVLDPEGNSFGPGTLTHYMTQYRAPSGALVFDAGTVQWAFGLDAVHDGPPAAADVRMQQATVNVLADMGVQPRNLQAGVTAATASTDTTRPVSVINYPQPGLTVGKGAAINVTGTASDSGGRLGAVEVSVDNGATWRPATGRESWVYVWTTNAVGQFTVQSRAVDDSGNLETPSAGVQVTIAATDTTPPVITGRTPASGATAVPVGSRVTVTFNEPMSAQSFSSSSFVLRRTGGIVIPADVNYDAQTRTGTLAPLGQMAFSETYTATVSGGASGVKDASGNPLAADSVWSFAAEAPPACPCSLWSSNPTPAVPAWNDPGAIEVGVRFQPQVDGTVSAVRFYKGAGNTGTHTGRLWSSDGTLLGSVTFQNETATGWQQASFASPVPVAAGATYVVSYFAPAGHYAVDTGYFATAARDVFPLRAPATTEGGNGVYRSGSPGFPNSTFNGNNYWVDLVFQATTGADNTPPTVIAVTPTAGATGINAGVSPTATFSEPVAPSSLTSSSVQLRTGNGAVVTASVSYDSQNRRVTVRPAAALAYSSAYSVTVKSGAAGPVDLSGNPMAADVSWSFTTGPAPVCPCSLWDSATAVPKLADSGENRPYELGVRFQPLVNGTIIGVRFYKSAANVGTHVGSLWASDGTLLASASFVNETASGWQEVVFGSPISVVANQTYVASYFTPVGRYAVDTGYFSTDPTVNPPLRAPAVTETPNGVFLPDVNGFPDQSFNGANYWVDVIFLSGGTDTTRPQVAATSPAAGSSTSSPPNTITVTFSEPIRPTTVTGSTVQLFTAAGTQVAGSVSYEPGARQATFVPNTRLSFGATYSGRVTGGSSGIKDLSGNALLADYNWSFTVGAAPPCPCTLFPVDSSPTLRDAGDTTAYELGVKFQAQYDGYVTALRFYKSAGNTGTHPVNLWSATGTLLATATATGETASGWQEVALATPVAVQAGVTYVASYFTSAGHYSFDAFFFSNATEASPLRAPSSSETPNGVFRGQTSGFPTQSYNAANYWVDVVYVATLGGDVTPPTVVSKTPAAGATGVSAGINVTARFSERLLASSATTSSFTLTGPSGAVPAAVSYNAATQTVTLDPNATLGFSTTYTATLKGGAFGITDTSGNPLSADVTWSFTTGAAPQCPCTLFGTVVPEVVDSFDTNPYELGVKFRSQLDGYITGVRFYQAPGNAGPHLVNLWSSIGELLASGSLPSDGGSGWREATLSAPVFVQADKIYVASYLAAAGHYSYNGAFFNSTYSAAPLEAPATSESPNGVYRSGASSGFPTESYNAGNYWVDVVFVTQLAADTTPPQAVSKSPAAGAQGAPTTGAVSISFSEPVLGVSSSSFELRNAAGTLIPSSVSYQASTWTAQLTPSAELATSSAYTALVRGGPSGVRDYAGNPLPADVSWTFTTAATSNCPCTLFEPGTTPAVVDSNDPGAYELGVKLRSTLSGYITGVRFYKSAANTGAHVAHLWSSAGALLATANFASETASGWQEASFATPVPIQAGITYVASYFTPSGRYSYTSGQFLGGGVSRPPLAGPGSSETPNGVYLFGGTGFPTQSYNATSYGVDAVFVTQLPQDNTPPQVVAMSPAAGEAAAPLGGSVTASFSEPVQGINGSTFELRDGAGTLVSASVSYDEATRTARLTPLAEITPLTTYTAKVLGGAGGVSDLAGNLLPSTVTWSFTTQAAPQCPCTLFGQTVPVVVDSGDGGPYELGVKFRSSQAGYITGIRFYKSAANTGTHLGNLWTSSGTLLATASFTAESASGWQEMSFASAVAIQAGTTYVASYFAPSGRYSFNAGFFGSGATVTSPLTAPGNSETPNGVFRAGSSGFPSQSFNATNYWADLVFVTQLPTDTTPPQVVSTTPAGGDPSASASSPVTATFSEPVQGVSTSSFELRDGAGALIPAGVSYDASTRTARLTPTAGLGFGASYTAVVRGGASGVRDLAGNPLVGDYSWSFTTQASPQCPCTIFGLATPGVVDSGDPGAYELGVKFRSSLSGYITAIRFYKSVANTGPHVVSLWTTSGTLVATASLTNSFGSGWQEVGLGAPVAVQAGVTYVASYHTPGGHYSLDSGYFAAGAAVNSPLTAPGNAETPNGLFRVGASGFPDQSFNAANYWVDVVFTLQPPTDTTPPQVLSTSPVSGAQAVAASSTVTATFSEPVQGLSSSSFQLLDAGGAPVAAGISYDAATRTARLTPQEGLGFGASYTAVVHGGASAVRDLAGNALAGDYSWSFTTQAAPQCPCNLFGSATPAVIDSGDGGSYELGVKFRSSIAGYITGVRFYKSAANTGQHVASLWTSAGALLATRSFVAETGSGWQEVSFASPVAIQAGVTYVASYFAPSGHFSYSSGYFAASFSTPPLTAPANAETPNGVFRAGSTGFPDQSFNATSYWVDVVFNTQPVTDTTPPQVSSKTPAAGATGVSVAASVTATFSEPVQGVSGSSFELRTSGGTPVSANVSYDADTRTARLTPSASLAFGASYTATVKGGATGVRDVAGNALAADVSWSFSTEASLQCPCNLLGNATPAVIDSGDGGAYEFGMNFRSAVNGYVTGIRFYKSAANTGTHVGSLWTTGGALLASATFSGETASGWQQVNVIPAVAVQAGVTYVVSYYAPAGRFSYSSAYFSSSVVSSPLTAPASSETPNGVFRAGASGFPDQSFNATNYWVDAVFELQAPSDTTPPQVSSVSPASGATGVPVGAAVTASFSEPVQGVSGSSFELRDGGGALVSASVSYDATTRTARLTPAASLGFGASYTATVRGGPSGVRDLFGNALAADFVWSFTTEALLQCPCTLFGTATPAVLDSGDPGAYEFGVKFRSAVNGSITGIRFYKSAANVGAHVANLWTSSGTLLATANFVGETGSGWQEVSFASPVAIQAGVTYVASYFAPAGHYSYTSALFASAVVSSPLTAPASSETPNGVFREGSSGFPTQSFNATSYWVDVIFSTQP